MMYAILAGTVGSYMSFYKQSLLQWWKTMSPAEFVTVQIVVAVIGWLMMKNMRR